MKIEKLKTSKIGRAQLPSPLKSKEWIKFVSGEEDVVSSLHQKELLESLEQEKLKFFEIAGPRGKIYHDPANLKCGIVTCGGLCPGINDIIRELVVSLWQSYGVRNIQGFRYGYRGLAKASEIRPLDLTPEVVDSIHRDGGTMLGSSRGPQDTDEMVDTLQQRKIGILFTVGGDGTMKGAHEIARRIKERKLEISVVSVPKTIDNDILFTEKTFGFETAVQAAADIIDSAHTEAKGAPECISIVKLFGRSSGFIAAYTALANRNVNYCLIPELPFSPQGSGGLLEILDRRIQKKNHAVIVVAEGAGQNLIRDGNGKSSTDKSGNLKLADIGLYLKRKINSYFKDLNRDINIKYFDPGYIIRSIPANAMDSLYCVHLAQNAVHAAMSGRTDMMISKWNSHYVNIPISMTAGKRKKVDPEGKLWRTVMKATAQPFSMFRVKK